MAQVRYKKRQGFENRLRSLAKSSRESAKQRTYSVRFGWQTPAQDVRTFVIHVGEVYDQFTQHRLSGRIMRCSVTKWHAIVDEVCRLQALKTPYGGVSRETQPVDMKGVAVRCGLPSELQDYINERDQELTFEDKVCLLNV